MKKYDEVVVKMVLKKLNKESMSAADCSIPSLRLLLNDQIPQVRPRKPLTCSHLMH